MFLGAAIRKSGAIRACLSVAALFGAVVASPFGAKIPLGGLPVTATDVMIVVAIVLLAPEGLGEIFSGKAFSRVRASVPLFAAALVSGVTAQAPLLSVKEIGQLGVYAVACPWLFCFVRQREHWQVWGSCALCAALVTSVVGLILFEFPVGDIGVRAYGVMGGLFCSTWLLWVLSTLTSRAKSGLGHAATWVSALLLLAIAAFSSVQHLQFRSDEQTLGKNRISERYREGYAALCVLSDHPLFGLGPGNYQLHIGQYYQGMPKENTIVPGTQLGFCVLTASLGVIGVSAYLFWLVRLWSASGLSPRNRLWARLFVGMVLVSGLMTPLLTERMLMPVALAHGWLSGGPVTDE